MPTIALIAHDRKKPTMVALVQQHRALRPDEQHAVVAPEPAEVEDVAPVTDEEAVDPRGLHVAQEHVAARGVGVLGGHVA